MQPVKKWSPELEGLRGLASLWVVLGHICILVNYRFPILSDPGIGVDLFILLSGFLMAKNYMDRKDSEPWSSSSTFYKFWIRRFFRIAPLYYILLIIAIGFGSYFGEYRDTIASFYSSTQTDSSRYSDNSLLNIFYHISFLFGLLPHYSFNTALPDWSIGLEMQFYFLFPFIMLATMRFGFSQTCFLFILLCMAAKLVIPDYFYAFPMPSLILMKLHLFISGMLISYAVRNKNLLYVAYALIASAAGFYLQNKIDIIRYLAEVGMIMMLSIILWPLGEYSKLTKMLIFPRWILTNRLSIFMGDVSYSVYLLHLLIVLPVISFLLIATPLSTFPALTRLLITATITIPITYLSATILYFFIERKGIQLGKSVIKRTTQKTTKRQVE